MKGSEQCFLRAIVGQPGRDEHVGGQTVDPRRGIDLTGALVGKEKEHLVLFDRPAESGSEHITLQRRTRDARSFQKWVVRIQSVVAEVFIDYAVEIILPALSDHLNIAAARSPVC